MSDERGTRIGHNEALYRQVNERIQDVNETFAVVTGEFAIVCECGDIRCTEQISVSREAYERVRANPHRFFVRHGHVAADVEDPVEDAADYVVVEKHEGAPKRVAEETDPRP